MANIGGNTTGVFRVMEYAFKNEIGEQDIRWKDVCSRVGWLGLQHGDSPRGNFKKKLEESTHVFLCDFNTDIYALADKEQDVRMLIKGKMYDVLLIDNPDEMDEQLEIYLRKVGAWDGG